MKFRIKIFLFVIVAFLYSCTETQRSPNEIQAPKPTPSVVDSIPVGQILEKKISKEEFDERCGWVEVGSEGYGAACAFVSGKLVGRAVRCRVIRIDDEALKIRFLESTLIAPGMDCPLRVLSGTTYWDLEGHFWKTKLEARAFLARKGWLAQ